VKRWDKRDKKEILDCFQEWRVRQSSQTSQRAMDMAEDLLFRLLALLERLGIWVAVVAWLAVALGAAAMAYVLRNERVTIWRRASLVGILALAANLADEESQLIEMVGGPARI
jgi:hypothetical protein